MEHAAHRQQRAKEQRKSIARMLGKKPNRTRPPGTNGIATARRKKQRGKQGKMKSERLTIKQTERSVVCISTGRGRKKTIRVCKLSMDKRGGATF